MNTVYSLFHGEEREVRNYVPLTVVRAEYEVFVKGENGTVSTDADSALASALVERGLLPAGTCLSIQARANSNLHVQVAHPTGNRFYGHSIDVTDDEVAALVVTPKDSPAAVAAAAPSDAGLENILKVFALALIADILGGK